MGDEHTTKKRKAKWRTSYSQMTVPEAEKRLGTCIDELKPISVDRMLANHSPEGEDAIKERVALKERVYERISSIDFEGYPTEASTGLGEAKVSDLVYAIISPILLGFRRKTGRKIRLEREKEIILTDNETGGMEEFVVMDRITVTEGKFVLTIEGKRSSVGEAVKQCLLALKDARENNGEDGVYGFVTTGESWRMLSYNGRDFWMTNKFDATFDTMGDEQAKWMKGYSVVVDCVYAAVSSGGIWKDAFGAKLVVR